jgi:metallo-beta-lactamase class B
MFKWLLVVLIVVTSAALLMDQAGGQRGSLTTTSTPAAQQGGVGANRTATGFGTTNTLTTIPEAGAGSAANDPTPEQLAGSKEAQAIIANAKKLAGADLASDAAKFCTWNGAADVPARNPSFGTVQVFDNLYYAGTGSVGVWIIKTSAGVILWDTLDNEEEVKTILEPGMKKFGMDPSQIRYIVIGHAHNDHTGGGEYLQRMYNPTILMGRLDWDTVMVSPSPHMRRGVDVIDGQKLTLGDTTLTLFLLPGHTPGSVSGIIPVKYQGQTYNMLNLTASRFSTYASLAPFERIFDEAKRERVVAVVQVHPEILMNKTAIMEDLHTYPPPGQHPLLWAPEKVARYMDVDLECGRARIAANRAALNAVRTPEYYHTPDPPAAPANTPAAGGRGGRGLQ